MSIRLKILIPMVAAATACAVVIGLLAIYMLTISNNNSNNAQLDKANALAIAILDQNREDAARLSGMAAENEQLVEALSAYLSGGDRQPMVNVSVSLMNATGVDFLTVMDTEGNVLVRAHEPDNFGDSLANQANVQNAMAGKQYTTTEKGSAVKLSVRCGTPIFDTTGTLIGVISLGYRLDQSHFVDYIKLMTGTEVTVFLGDTRVSTTVVNEKGDRAVDTQASEAVSKQVLAGGDYIGRANVMGQMLLSHYSPIRDVEGVVLGMLFVGIDTSDTDSATLRTIWIMAAALVLMVIITVCIALSVSGKIARPIQEMSEAAKRLANGDVDVDISVTRGGAAKDETVHLAQAFSEMIDSNRERARLISVIAEGDLRGQITPKSDVDVVGVALGELLSKNNSTFSGIREASSHLDAASSQIADGALSLAQGATEQAAAVEQLSASINEVAGATHENAEKARRASKLAEIIKQSAERGNSQMGQMLSAVREINDASHNIVKVIKVVEDIAFQTNILALNAAVEAARAGQHGKGFAVVAEEVRNLAAKSAEAAKDTGDLIAGSVEKAELGARIAGETAGSLAEIVAGIDESGRLIDDIARSYAEQDIAIGQINMGIDQVSQIVQTNSAAAEESASSSAEMSNQSAILHELMEQFKLDDTLLPDGGITHRRALLPRESVK